MAHEQPQVRTLWEIYECTLFPHFIFYINFLKLDPWNLTTFARTPRARAPQGYGGPPINKTPSPRDLPPILARSLLTRATPDPRPHPDFEAPDAKTSKIR
jgi:hypothetical protein